MIFIAHSLGGIVVKKALIIAYERSNFYGSLLQQVHGIVFMGTPHRGGDLAYWANYLANILKIALLGTRTNPRLLADLQKNSPALADISKQFVERGQKLDILTFFEQERYLGTVVSQACDVFQTSTETRRSSTKIRPVLTSQMKR